MEVLALLGRGEDSPGDPRLLLQWNLRVFWSALMAPWAPLLWQVNDQEMKKQQDEIMAIMKMREAASSGTQVGPGHEDLPGAPSLREDLSACSSISWRCPRQGVSVLGGGDLAHMCEAAG